MPTQIGNKRKILCWLLFGWRIPKDTASGAHVVALDSSEHSTLLSG